MTGSSKFRFFVLSLVGFLVLSPGKGATQFGQGPCGSNIAGPTAIMEGEVNGWVSEIGTIADSARQDASETFYAQIRIRKAETKSIRDIEANRFVPKILREMMVDRTAAPAPPLSTIFDKAFAQAQQAFTETDVPGPSSENASLRINAAMLNSRLAGLPILVRWQLLRAVNAANEYNAARSHQLEFQRKLRAFRCLDKLSRNLDSNYGTAIDFAAGVDELNDAIDFFAAFLASGGVVTGSIPGIIAIFGPYPEKLENLLPFMRAAGDILQRIVDDLPDIEQDGGTQIATQAFNTSGLDLMHAMIDTSTDAIETRAGFMTTALIRLGQINADPDIVGDRFDAVVDNIVAGLIIQIRIAHTQLTGYRDIYFAQNGLHLQVQDRLSIFRQPISEAVETLIEEITHERDAIEAIVMRLRRF